MSDLKDFKCPNCTGKLVFDTETQKLSCPYCDGSFDPDIFDGGKEYEVSHDTWNESDYQIYSCKSCGGTIMADKDTVSSKCPYCDSSIVVIGNVKGQLKPKKIIPFKYDKKQAIEEYRKHLAGKYLLPAEFRSQATFDEIKGIYVPFWIFDGKANAKIWFDATKTKTYQEGEYDVTETNYYKLFRSGHLQFASVPVDASDKIDDIVSQSVEPFDNKGLKDFNDNYLAGYYADKYSIDANQSREIADQRIINSAKRMFDSTINDYDKYEISTSCISLENGLQEYVMYPIWILNVKYKDNKYIFAMNGQTGKFVGDLPIDHMKHRFVKTTVFLVVSLLIGLIQLILKWR